MAVGVCVASRHWDDGVVIHVLPANDTHRISTRAADVLTALHHEDSQAALEVAKRCGLDLDEAQSVLEALASLGLAVRCDV